MEKSEPSYTVGNVNWCSHCGKWYDIFSKNKKIELPYDPEIPFLSIYSKKTKTPTWKGTCTPMFIAASFTIVKVWKFPKCLPTDEWIKEMWCIYIYIYIYTHTHTHTHTYTYSGILLSHKKEWNAAICNNTDGLGGYYAKWNKSDRERQILYDITYMRKYMWNLKNKAKYWI